MMAHHTTFCPLLKVNKSFTRDFLLISGLFSCLLHCFLRVGAQKR